MHIASIGIDLVPKRHLCGFGEICGDGRLWESLIRISVVPHYFIAATECNVPLFCVAEKDSPFFLWGSRRN
jgi:hypothetical protein